MLLNQSTRRLQWLLWGFVAWTGLLFGRLVWLQVIRHDAYVLAARSQQQKIIELAAARGTIFDRTGQPLAMTLEADTVVVDAPLVEDLPSTATLLGTVFHLDPSALLKRMQSAKDRNSHYLIVARKVAPEESQRVRDLKIEGVVFEKELRRYYPREALAANVVGSTGFITKEDVMARGNSGIELAFEKDLRGVPGQARVYRDSRAKYYDQDVLLEPIRGADLTLTLDPNLQFRAEAELASAVEASGAEAGSVVAMDPYTGEILAMASYPTFDPNLSPAGGEGAQRARQNLPVSRTFEPGSVFKVITVAAALENTSLTPDSMIDCGNGVLNLYGRVIHDHDPFKTLTMSEVLAKSSNIGAIRIALATGNDKFYEYQKRFGFGNKTGLPLPGESAGILWPVKKSTKSSIGSLAMGHEIGVTSMQLVRAGAVIANGGLRVEPRLLISRQKAGQEPERFKSQTGERVLQPETAATMRRMMEGVVLEGTGRRAVLQGYTSAGKTGSAQIYDPATGVYSHTYNASFLGFAPVGNPRIVIAVTLHGTKGGSAGFGGARAAPVFRDVALTALRILDVPKDLPDPVVVSQANASENDLSAPGESDAAVAETAAEQLARMNEIPEGRETRSPNETAQDGNVLRARAVSSVTSPLVRADAPDSGVSVAGQRPFLSEVQRQAFSTERPAASGPSVPDFLGMTKRNVLEESLAAGLRVELSGDGLAAAQDPPAGSRLLPGMAVKVRFGR